MKRNKTIGVVVKWSISTIYGRDPENFCSDYPGRRKLLPEGCGGGHQPDEYVDVKDIEKAFFIYVEAFQAMDRASLKGENHKYCWRQPGESVHFLR